MSQLNPLYYDHIYYKALNSYQIGSENSCYMQPENKYQQYPSQYYNYNGNINNISNSYSFDRGQPIINKENIQFINTDCLVPSFSNSSSLNQVPISMSLKTPNKFNPNQVHALNNSCKLSSKYYYDSKGCFLPSPFGDKFQIYQAPEKTILYEQPLLQHSPTDYNKIKTQNLMPDLTIKESKDEFSSHDKVQTNLNGYIVNNNQIYNNKNLVENVNFPEFEDKSNLIQPHNMKASNPLSVIPCVPFDTKSQLKILFEDEYMKNNNQNIFLKNEKNQRKIKIISSASPMWTSEEDKLLKKLKVDDKLGWRDISMYFPSRTINACQFRWRRLTVKGDKRLKSEFVKLDSNTKITKTSKSLIKRSP